MDCLRTFVVRQLQISATLDGSHDKALKETKKMVVEKNDATNASTDPSLERPRSKLCRKIIKHSRSHQRESGKPIKVLQDLETYRINSFALPVQGFIPVRLLLSDSKAGRLQ